MASSWRPRFGSTSTLGWASSKTSAQRTQVNTPRQIRLLPGALLAPLVAPIPTMIAAFIMLDSVPWRMNAFQFHQLVKLVGPTSIFVSFVGILLFGIPSVWLLRLLDRLSIFNLTAMAALASPVLTLLMFPAGMGFSYSRAGWAWVVTLSFVGACVAIVFGVVNGLSWRVSPNAQIAGSGDG